MFDYTGTYTDKYQLSMSQVYFLRGKRDTPAVFDYFFRKLPFGGGYAVFAGLNDLLEIIENLKFNGNDLEFLKEQGYNHEFIRYLKDFSFSGTIYGPQEGDLVFPFRPILQVEATIVEAQIIETLLLNILNFQTLIATKASRMRQAAEGRILIDFGLRRAQGPGGYYASRAALIGGFDATSNVRAAMDYNIPVSGTMAHSFISCYDTELSAFVDFAEVNSKDCILLIDTYDTLKSGLPNAIAVAKKMEESGRLLAGIRLDSGDLAYLSKECRKRLDQEGLGYVKISVSNQLDENIIKSLLDQKAPVDSFGVGTNLVTGNPDGALDGVYKLSLSDGKPRIKLSENISKITLPHLKQVYRIINGDGQFFGADAITLVGEKNPDVMFHPLYPLKSLSILKYKKEPLLHKIMENGVRLHKSKPVTEIAEYCRQRLDRLPEEFKRFDNPHIYKIGISTELQSERDRLIHELKNNFR